MIEFGLFNVLEMPKEVLGFSAVRIYVRLQVMDKFRTGSNDYRDHVDENPIRGNTIVRSKVFKCLRGEPISDQIPGVSAQTALISGHIKQRAEVTPRRVVVDEAATFLPFAGGEVH